LVDSFEYVTRLIKSRRLAWIRYKECNR